MQKGYHLDLMLSFYTTQKVCMYIPFKEEAAIKPSGKHLTRFAQYAVV